MDTLLKQIYIELDIDHQSSPYVKKLYAMSMQFDIQIKESPQAEKTVIDLQAIKTKMRLFQIKPYIPDTAAIDEYRELVCERYRKCLDNPSMDVSTEFSGYNNICVVTPNQEEPGVPTKDALHVLIEKAYTDDDSIIYLDEEPGGGDTVVHIGDTWLYFDTLAQEIEPDEYRAKYDTDHIVTAICNTVYNMWETDKDDPEMHYIFALLYEHVENLSAIK